MHVQRGRSPKSSLSTALDHADPDAGHVVALLDAIPRACERAQEGIGQGRRDEEFVLDELA